MTAAATRLGLDHVVEAARRISGHVRRTPLLGIDSVPGLLLKAEHLQCGGSFKMRGASNAVLGRGPRPGEVVTGSSGNHGIALATLGRTLGLRVTVVMAAAAHETKATTIRALGARVLRIEGGVAERDRHAEEYAAHTGAVFVPSSDDDLVAAGQGTVGLEVFQDAPDVGTVFVPTGGGGLLAGMCLAASYPARPVRIVGVEPAGGRRYACSLAAGRAVRLPPPDTIADGLRGQCPGERLLPIIRSRVDDLIAVTDEQIERATDRLRRAGIAAEPSGGVALAGALQAGFTGPAAAIVSGGNGHHTQAGRREGRETP